ncbi:PAS domain-containing protein [Halocola ammonii]
MKPLKLKQLRLNYIFVVAFLLIIAYTIFSYVKLNNSINDVEWISRSEEFQEKISELADHFEAGLEAHENYLESGREEFREDYAAKMSRVAENIEQAKNAARDTTQKIPLLKIDELLIEQKQDLDDALHLKDQNSSESLINNLVSEANKRAIRINGYLRDLENRDKALMQQRIADFEDSTSDVLFQTVLFGLITLIIVVVAFLKISYDLKKRTKSEKQLLESNLKFQALFDQSFQFVGLTDAAGKMIDANKPALAFLKMKKDEIEGMPLAEMTGNILDKQGKKTIRKAIKTASSGEFFRSDLHIRPGNEKTTTIDFSLKPVFNEEGKVSLLIAEGRDVTELHNITRALAESREIYDLVLRGSSAGIWDWTDVNKDATWWSPKFYELLGYSPNEVQATIQLFRELLHPEDRKRTFELLNQALKGEKSYQVEYRLRTKSGEYRWFHATAQVNFDSKGKAIRMAGSIIDITERRKAESALSSVAQLMAAAESIARIGSFEWDTNSNEVIWSEGMYKIYELENDEIQPSYEYMTRHIVKEDFKENQDIVREARMREMPYQVNYRIKINGKIKHLKELAQVKKDENGNFAGFVGTVRDNTNEVFSAKRISAAMEDLERSNEELEQFAYVASHDLQEPLRKIRAFGDRLLSKYDKDDTLPGKEYVDRMQNAAERMQILIDDLLTFSRVSRGQQREEKIDLQKIFEEVSDDLSVTLSAKNGKLIQENKLPPFIGSRTQMRQLFQNLLGNAIKFAKQETPPEVKVSYRKVDASEVFSHDNQFSADSEKYHEIVIKDNGIGFEQEYVDKIFTIFQRLHGKSEFKGTGIGLAVCKKIVENHSGVLTARSKPEEGAEFYIFLPDRLLLKDE